MAYLRERHVNVIPLRPKKPAYEPLDKPGTCQTPHPEDRPARPYPGGMLCDSCIEASRRAYRTTDENQAS